MKKMSETQSHCHICILKRTNYLRKWKYSSSLISSLHNTVNLILIYTVDLYFINIVESNITDHFNKSDCSFCNWYYMTVFFKFIFSLAKDFTKMTCLNTKCIMLLIDKKFLHKHLLNIVIQKTANTITACEINSWMHKCQKYVYLNLYLSNILNRKTAIVYITCNIYFVENLQINFLIDINIIKLKQISTNIVVKWADWWRWIFSFS